MKSIISVFIFSVIVQVYANDGIRQISSDSNSAVVEFIPSYDTSKITINHQPYIRVIFFDGTLPEFYEPGAPELLIKKMNIGVPSEFGNTIQIISSEYKDIAGNVCPVPVMHMKDGMTNYHFEINEKYSTSHNFELITFGDYGLSRGLPLQTINIAPVQFDYSNHIIRLYTKIVFRINFTRIKPESGLSIDDDLLKDAVINYKTAKGWIRRDSKLKKQTRSSVLASGRWYTFEAPEEGIYKIDRQMLSQMGIDPASVNPSTIRIFNNGGKDLPEDISVQRPDDFQENAIYVYGEEDGKFDDGDYILFYGRGINFWETDNNGIVKRYYHTYSTKNLYWITSGGTAGKRMEIKSGASDPPDFVQTTTKAYLNWEEDKSKIQPSGRLYVGDGFGENSSRTYMTKLDALIPGSKIEYTFNFVNKSEGTAALSLRENDIEILRTNIRGVVDMEDPKGERGIPLRGAASFTGQLPEDRSVLKFTYSPAAPSSTGYLDFFEIYYDKYLKAANGQQLFYTVDTTGIIQYELSGFPSGNIKVFDITDYSEVKIITGANVSGGDCSFKINENRKRKYFALESAAYKTPVNIKEGGNSDLHGIAAGAEFIIITPKLLREEAERLKRHKENDIKIKISTTVVNIEDIFNEFSCGIIDVCAIRDFLKYAYDNWQIKPEYVLLFGDGDYDYKNTEGKNQNYIIPYESAESYSYINSYATDDFFAKINGSDFFPDLAIGRLNILSTDDAKIAVDKIIKYETGKDYGLWRNLITFVGDDGPAAAGDDDGSTHTDQSEIVANRILPSYFDQEKIYLALYPTVQTATGRRKPAANKAIIDAINKGTLVLSYIGHGNPEVWAHEYVFDKGPMLPQLRNDKQFFLTAATCDFGRYDIPGRENQSSVELMMFKPDGGSIGVFTAARTVYSHLNGPINNNFYQNLFVRDSLNLIRPVGKGYFKSKLIKYDPDEINDLKFHLFCDPTLRLAAPEAPVHIDSINGREITSDVQINALSNMRISGSIVQSDGTQDSDFNGEVLISVFDSESNIVIKEMGNYQVSKQGGLIYRGKVTIVNGRFSTEFTVPKDISYENKNGKIAAYVYNETSDGIGYTKNIIVGGTDSTRNDGKGPDILIGFDNDISENEYLVTPDFELNVKLADQTGLNTTGTGIGHKLEGILNGNERAPIDFTNYFVGDLNSGGKSGVIKYKFNGIEQGDYNIQVKAWDVFNNFASAERSFTVVDGEDIVLRDVYNYPNPFVGNTTFTFQHNISGPVDVKINIYTVSGRKIKILEEFSINDKFVRIDWDGRDADDNIVSNGTYLYKVIVSTVDNRFRQEVIGKMAILR